MDGVRSGTRRANFAGRGTSTTSATTSATTAAEITTTVINWTYYGGPVAGRAELVAPNDIRVGDRRQDLVTAYTDFQDFGDEIDVYQPAPLRFGLEGGTIKWFGVIDCALEGDERPGILIYGTTEPLRIPPRWQ